jgi:hypothetical protein
MVESVSHYLAPWSSFYIMIGSAAASLTGLMFVVITLVKGTERMDPSRDGISAFSTPTVVHFCAALLVAGILGAPWRALLQPAIILALAGALGVVYVVRLVTVAKRLDGYQADSEDWMWYTILPVLAYGALFAGGVLLPAYPVDSLFVLAAGSAGLIFIGIRNAWDIVTYIAVGRGS